MNKFFFAIKPFRTDRRQPLRAFILATFIIGMTQPLSADTILLKNGKNLEGQIIEKTKRHIKMQTKNGVIKVPFTMMDDATAEQVKEIPEKIMTKSEAPVLYKGKKITREDTDVEKILQPVFAQFKDMTSFQCNGTGVSNSIQDKMMDTTQAYITVKFQRPNYFLIVLENTLSKGPKETLAAWNNGATTLFYSSAAKTYNYAPNDTMALMDIGYLKILYQLFSGCESECPLVQDLAYLGNTDLNGEPCYLLSRTMPIGYYVLWISKKRNLITRIDYTLSGYPDEFYRQPTTNEEIETILKAMEMEPSEENIKIARKIILNIEPPPEEENEATGEPKPKKAKKKKKKKVIPPPKKGPQYETSIYAELTLDNFELDWEIDPGEFRFGIPEGTAFQSEEDLKKIFEEEKEE